MPPLSLNFIFPSSPPRTPSFSRRPPNLSEKKWWSWTYSSLDHCEIWARGSKLISKHSHRWIIVKFWNHVRSERNALCIVVFSFSAETQKCLGKTMILNSLTVGFSLNLDMLLEIQFRTSSPLGFAKKNVCGGRNLHHTKTV